MFKTGSKAFIQIYEYLSLYVYTYNYMKIIVLTRIQMPKVVYLSLYLYEYYFG